VIVVDDEPAIRRAVGEMLRARGHEVILAGGGPEALRAVYERSSAPAVLVADITMPGMTGIELAARLRAVRPAIRVVLMTGLPDSAELARDRPELVSAVLVKPFSAAELLAAVDLALGDRGTAT
jgi:CheY-like chemotaxis protein